MTTYEKQLLLNDLLAINKEAEIKDFIEVLRVNRNYDPETVRKVNELRERRERDELKRKIYGQ